MEELFESEVLWPENHQHPNSATAAMISVGVSLRKAQTHRASSAASAPMNIPRTRCMHAPEGGGGGHGELEAGEVVPPHILMSRRRMAEQAAFSLCSGQGRTLKGRDLRHVRDSVLRMTGFLEG